MVSALSMFVVLALVTAIAAVAFVLSMLGVFLRLFGSLMRMLVAIIAGLFVTSRTSWAADGPSVVRCRNPKCTHTNPRSAAFCRRCGQPLGRRFSGSSTIGASSYYSAWSTIPAIVRLRSRLAAKKARLVARGYRIEARLQRHRARARARMMRGRNAWTAWNGGQWNGYQPQSAQTPPPLRPDESMRA